MAIDSLNILMKEKANIEVKEINDTFIETLKHISDSGLDVEDIKSKFTILRANPYIIVPIQPKVEEQKQKEVVIQDSLIIKESDMETLEGFFGRKIKLELKYRGSRDGFLFEKIKPLLKDVSDLITVIKSEHN